MSLLSKIRNHVAQLFGSGESEIKDMAVEATERLVENHISEGAVILQKFLAAKGVNVGTEVLAEGVSLVLKGGEELLSKSPCAQVKE